MKGRICYLRAVAGLIIDICLLIALFFLLGDTIRDDRVQHRGIEDGLHSALPPLSQPRLGANVALEQYSDQKALLALLDELRALGIGTLRQRFSWAVLEPSPGEFRWQRWDETLPIVREEGFQLIAVLDTSPAWARPPWEQDNIWAPPAHPEDYAAFCRAFAQRYGHLISAYQIWDEPNIYPHWGKGEIDPAGYVALLRAASAGIREVVPEARIIAGGLAPNVEPGGRNMSDVRFLQEIYRRGAGDYFDILGAKAYGFWSGAGDRQVDPKVLNYSRVILLREEMVRRGDGHKPIWAVDGGWCALPANWAGQPSPHGSDTPLVQGARLEQAIRRAEREWPWMGLLCLVHAHPNAPADDPIWGHALWNPQGVPSQFHEVLGQLAYEHILYPGLSSDIYPYFQLMPRPDRADLLFWGDRLLLQVQKGVLEGQLTIWVQGRHTPTRIQLSAPQPTSEWVDTGRVWPGLHRVQVYGAPSQRAMLLSARVGNRPRHNVLWRELLVGLVALAWWGRDLWRHGKMIPWRELWGQTRNLWRRLPQAVQWGACLVPFLGIILSPWPWLRLTCLTLYGFVALFRWDMALLVAVGCIPLAPLHVPLGLGTFSLVEIGVLIAVAARAWDVLLGPSRVRWRGIHRRLVLVDALVALLVVLGVVSASLAEYQRVAWREFRLVILEPCLLYVLLRSAPDAEGKLRVWLQALWASTILVSLFALVAYVFPWGVIEAEGVRRARAFYGSPNNLALYLERMLPVGLALSLWRRGRARFSYAAGSAAVLLALGLSFSRGALFLGVPVGLLTLALIAGKGARRLAFYGFIVICLLIIPLMGTPRLASLLNPTEGTGFLRLKLWEAAWDMVKEHPWTGVGPDNFLYYYGDYIRPGAEADRWLSHPHDLLLDFWLRLGLAGLLWIIGVVVVLLAQTRRALPSLRDDRLLYACAVGLIAGLVGALAHGLVDAFFFVIELAHWFMFALAWLTLYAKLAVRRDRMHR